MITRKNSGISFCYISLFILLSCSKKSDHTTDPFAGAILNIITYTITDTTGIDHTYSDTAELNPDGTYSWLIDGKYLMAQPIAYIWQPFPNNINRLEFFFLNQINDVSESRNILSFALPYFQASLSGTNKDSLPPPFGLNWKGIHYAVGQTQFLNGVVENVYLAYCTYSTNISDSSGGYVTGSFNFSGTTVDSGKMKITGKFSNLTTNYTP
jgi:hypothetical protein